MSELEQMGFKFLNLVPGLNIKKRPADSSARVPGIHSSVVTLR